MTELDRALDTQRVLLCVGSGGVGKTTMAAVLALEAARRGRRTAVLTVDPAERLKDALGIGSRRGPRRVSLASIGARGAHLDALLLDVKRTFDELVIALSPTREQAQRILENRLYQNLSGTLAGTAEYMAVETVYRLAEEGGYDLLVVDTPPARHAVEFLDAPRRLLALLDSRAFAILKDPTTILPAAGSRLAHLLLGAVLRGLERFTGIGLVGEVGEFVAAIETLTDALRERVRTVGALLRAPGTQLLLVAAPEPRLVGETETLVTALGAVGLSVSGIVVNRALPRRLFGREASKPPPMEGVPAALAGRLRRGYNDLRTLARHQEATLAPLVERARASVIGEVPLLSTDPGSLADLAAIAGHLFPARTDKPEPASGLGR
jgi:anion-transporting  ArsA/GET3 family ATPase